MAAEVEVNFCQCAFARQRRVQHVEGAGVPPRTRRVALKHITLLPNDAPYVALKCHALMRIDQVEKLVIAGTAVGHFRRTLQKCPSIETLDDCKHLFGAIGIDKVNCPFVSKQWMTRMKP